MSVGTSLLWDELSELADAYAGLARSFSVAARRLQMPGALPDEGLLAGVAEQRSRLRALRGRIEDAAGALGVPLPDDGGLETLKELAHFLEDLTAAERRAEERAARSASAEALLDRVRSLRHVALERFEPLEQCREQARRLREEILRGPAEHLDEVIDALAADDHPFAYVLRLASGADGVEDDLWESLFEAVGREFGRPLAAALARGKVVASPAPGTSADDRPMPLPAIEPEPTGLVIPIRLEQAGRDEDHAPTPDVEPAPSEALDQALDPALAALASDEVLDPVVEEAYPYLPGGIAALLAARGRTRNTGRRTTPGVERLENVRLLSCNVIAGFVFLDANNNGFFDATEAPVAGSLIELRNQAGVVVGSATTDAGGAYSFSTDSTISTAPVTESQSVSIPSTRTNFSTPFSFAQFDPSLGELLDVQILVEGALTSVIRAENTSTSSPATLQAVVAGELRLTGPGLDLTAAISDPGGTFEASVFDGVSDYAGTSGHDFGSQTAAIDRSFTLSAAQGDDLGPFVGTGTFSGTLDARASSSATGGANIDYETESSAQAILTVIYRYAPSNCLAPGNYTIVQLDQPAGTLNGKRSSEGAVFPPPATGPDTIPITLDGRDILDNNFGELLPSRLAGFVYVDANNDGVKQAGEAPIPGASLTLTGVDDLGRAVSMTASTASDGSYEFANLRPGTYRIAEAQPAGYLDGKDAVGTQGGTLGDDEIRDIVIGQNVNGIDNNFGELLPARLSGFVYSDANNDGVKEPGEAPIPGVSITLSGVDDLGRPVNMSAITDAAGAYAFGGLRPGTYQIAEAQPAGWLDGKDTIGSQGGTVGDDLFTAIALGQGVDGIDNNFGELLPARLAGFVYFDRDDDGIKAASEPGISGTTITLSGVDDHGRPVSRVATTDADGAYSFGDLRPGTYRIVETQPSGWLDGKDTIGTQGGAVGDDEFSNIALAAGVDGINNNFGELSIASLSGFVYHDRNDDGLKQPGEEGIAGTLITLTGVDDLGQPVSRTALTDANGAYAFGGLRPGTYRIVEAQPAGWLDGKDRVGTQGGTLGDDQIDAIALLQGIHGVDNNFGEILPAALNGYVYFDLNKNGLKDPGEGGFANIPIRLTGTDSLGAIAEQVATTDAGGFYSFGGLRPGNYTVTQLVQPPGFIDGLETRGNVVPLPNSRGTDAIPEIIVLSGGLAPDNNFGEEVEPGVEPEELCEDVTQIVDVTRLGIHHQPTRLLIRFDNDVDPASATNLANYRLVQASWHGRLARRPIPLRSAVYDPATRTVTLTVAHPINIHYPYQLTVNGVLDDCPQPIDGDGDGRPGGAYVTTITKANYPFGLSDAAIQAQKAATWAARYPRLAAQRLTAGPRPRRA